MDKIEVKIIQSEFFQRKIECLQRAVVTCIGNPYFGGDKKGFPFYAGIYHGTDRKSVV